MTEKKAVESPAVIRKDTNDVAVIIDALCNGQKRTWNSDAFEFIV